MQKTHTLSISLLAAAILAYLPTAIAQQGPKPENLIKWRQSAYQVIAWNSGRIKSSLDGLYNKEEIVRASNVIAALANSGLGTLYAAGSEQGKGWHDTAAKPELFTDTKKVAELSANFSKEATELARVAAGSDTEAVKAQYDKLAGTCKACHDSFRAKS